jgi:AcrR family transcriptional regulator
MATISTARRRAAHLGPERRRPQVLDAALAVFAERGYEGASMEAIAERAGVSKPVVYDCYAAKDELFRALLEREEQRLLEEIAEHLPERPGEDPGQTLVACLTAFLSAVAASPDAYRVILGAGSASAIARRIERGRALQVDAVTALVGRWLLEIGADEVDDARLAAYLLVGLAEGAVRALLAEPERFSPETVATAITRLEGVWAGGSPA